MYELIHLTGGTYYIDSPSKIGLYKKEDGHVYLIDSGNDKGAGKKALKILEEKGWTLDAIVNTHTHADHIGGNHVLQERTGCQIFVPEKELSFAAHPVLEPSLLFGGYPPKRLRGRFLCAEPSRVHPVTDERFPEDLQVIPLPGHSPDMVGVRTADQVVFLGDCYAGENIIRKYHISYLYEAAEYLNSLESAKKIRAEYFVPSHSEVVRDVSAIADQNSAEVERIAAEILDICAKEAGFEEILQSLFARFQIKMDLIQYALAGSTLRSYLSWLKDQGKITDAIKDNQLLWRKEELTCQKP